MRSNPRAPRWAGWTAALFGVEYAVSKVVMATRGELGVVGHPAPREATESFTGSVVAAQLGNAGLGMLMVALALALVHRWGRRIPSALLAAGAVASAGCGIAGMAVVVASLTGIREDHGQWGVDSLVLGAVPLVAWVVLAGAALRAVRLPRLAPAVLAAAGGCLLYGSMKLSWALGGELLMRQSPLGEGAMRDMLAREPYTVAGHWISVALAAVGVAVAIGTARAPGRLRGPVLWLARIVGGLMVLRASYGAATDLAVMAGALDGTTRTATWDLLLWSPFFGAWGAAWLRAGLAAEARVQVRVGLAPVAATWALGFAVVHAYWAAGGETWMHGDDGTPASRAYIGVIALLGVAAAVVAHRRLALPARIGGAALLVGVVVGTARWIVHGDLGDDGAAGVVITAYFLVGGVLFTALGRPGRPRSRSRTPSALRGANASQSLLK